MADIDASGMVAHPNVLPMRFTYIERGALAKIEGIIVHQTDSFDEKSVFASYRGPNAAGAHFLIGKNGTIWQTASLHQRTHHVGKLKPRCLAQMSCAPAELKTLRKASAEVSNRIEMTKSVPQRYPSNSDSVGIEIVGKASLPPNKPIPPGLSGDERLRFQGNHAVYEAVTPAQQVSLQWLIDFLRQNLHVPATEVHRHPDVSRKNPTEASSAQWK
ncbi:N-acetylmuramoyl-L-alanine amidase [Xenophilus arseniciresistens]|uniref:N-acetylmuramoyl-L-alanine amidase n=1 Tax=Xenophilus arseniciresistens TaxID=1283306 RepID=A0AAE3NB83_9BURK|nr:N-acetylmuramoyl-L-alanine amidase [Xenophilus arseniciresistens]MDA7417969.1 N-acetylmuramoyl-L-alanine amidase [Xenophilus arseniciresistens]